MFQAELRGLRLLLPATSGHCEEISQPSGSGGLRPAQPLRYLPHLRGVPERQTRGQRWWWWCGGGGTLQQVQLGGLRGEEEVGAEAAALQQEGQRLQHRERQLLRVPHWDGLLSLLG